jgi:hypothetical protein
LNVGRWGLARGEWKFGRMEEWKIGRLVIGILVDWGICQRSKRSEVINNQLEVMVLAQAISVLKIRLLGPLYARLVTLVSERSYLKYRSFQNRSWRAAMGTPTTEKIVELLEHLGLDSSKFGSQLY